MISTKFPLSRRGLLGAGLVLGSATLVGCSMSGDPRTSTEGLVAWPADDLWPDQFNNEPDEIQEAYRYAVANEEVLQWMPCFCGCVTGGHRHNFDCYVREVRDDGSVALDAMSFGGDICIGVTRDVMRLRAEGESLFEIRKFIDETWGDAGPATNTPLPPKE